MVPLEQAHTLLDGRVPVAVIVEDGLGGVTAWSRRLETAFRDHPKYNLIMVECPVFADGVTGSRSLCCLSREDLREALDRLRPAIVVPNYAWEAFGLCAELIREGHALRAIGFCRTDEALYYTPLAWFEPIIAQFAAVSPECAEKLARRIPHRKDDIHRMPTGVWVPEPLERAYQTAPIRLVYGGRMSQVQKRVLDFVPLVKQLLALRVDFTLDLIGAGSQTEKLERAMGKLRHGGRVRFTGALPPEAMPAVWRAHDVYVQTSEYEGTSNSMLESMAEGAVPVVADASSGVRGVLTGGENGFIVRVGDMAAMARCIAQLAANPALLARMGAAAHEKAKDYGMDRYRDRFTAMLDATLGQPVRTWPHALELPPEVARLIRPLKRRPGCGCSPTPAAVTMDPPPPRNEPMTVVSAADDHFAMPLAAMVRSLLDHLGPERRIELHVLDGGITAENKARLLRSWDDARLVAHWAPVGREDLAGLPVSGHVNALTHARLLIPRRLPESIVKAIYLDADLIVRRDISELWAMDARGHALLAAQDMTAPYMDAARALRNFSDCAEYLSQVTGLRNYAKLGIAPTAKYFNAGVLVFNLDLWREQDLGPRVINYMRGHRRAVRYWDQDGLNAVLHGQWAEIDGRWNQIPHIFRYPSAQQSPFPPGIFERLRDDPWIVHFATRQKPWHYMDAHTFSDDFFAALDRTAWAGWRPPSPENLLRNPGFRDWEDGRPTGWETSGHGVYSLTEGPDGAPAAEVSVMQAAGDAYLAQQLAPEGEVARSRLLVRVYARSEEPHALSIRVSHVVDGVEQTVSRHHAGDGRWHMVRHEIRLPIGTDPRRIRVRIVLRGHATKSVQVAGSFAAIVPPAGGTPFRHTPVTRLAAALPNTLRRLLRKAEKRLR